MNNLAENFSEKKDIVDLTLVASQLSAGEQLKVARRVRDLTLSQVAQRLNLSERYIVALETDDFSSLPGPIFVRGYLRSYAQCVEIEKHTILDAYDRCMSVNAMPAKLRKREKLKAFSTAPVMRALGVLSVLLFVLSSMYWWRGEQSPVVSHAMDRMTVVEVGTVNGETKIKTLDLNALPFMGASETQQNELSAVSLMGDVLLVEFANSSWLEVRNIRGEVLFSGVKQSGEKLELTSLTPFDIVIGNAAAVKLSYNSAPVDLSNYTLESNVAELQLGM